MLVQNNPSRCSEDEKSMPLEEYKLSRLDRCVYTDPVNPTELYGEIQQQTSDTLKTISKTGIEILKR